MTTNHFDSKLQQFISENCCNEPVLQFFTQVCEKLHLPKPFSAERLGFSLVSPTNTNAIWNIVDPDRHFLPLQNALLAAIEDWKLGVTHRTHALAGLSDCASSSTTLP